MFEQFQRLFRDFSFLLKVEELIIACVCMDEVQKFNEYTIPKWLWTIYCIDTCTYAIIFFCIGMTHVFEKPRRLPEFTYFSLGAILHFIGAVGGFVRSRYADFDQPETPRSELKIGLLLFANFIVLICEAAHMAYVEHKQLKHPGSRTMGNTLIPYPIFTMEMWAEKKKFLICKTVSLIACIIGTGIYMSPLEPYLEVPCFGLLVPTFITGYMLIHSSDIFQLLMRKDYIFLNVWFSVIGALGSLACGIYQAQKWIGWMMIVYDDPHPEGDYNIMELVLSLAFLTQFGSMAVVVYFHLMNYCQSLK